MFESFIYIKGLFNGPKCTVNKTQQLKKANFKAIMSRPLDQSCGKLTPIGRSVS